MPGNEKKFPCTFDGCFSIFKKHSHLLRHRLIHTDERPFPCDFNGCSATFRSESHLKRHKLIHTNEKSFKCQFVDCNVSCNTEWNLKRHIRRTHNGPFKCQKCEKEFKKNKFLQQHVSMEHKNSTVACNFPGCNAMFALPSKLKQHMKMHNKGYICPVKGCSQKFQLWSECRQHAELCKNKEMNCKTCGKTFTILHNLRAHEKIHEEEREVYQCTYNGCGRFYTKQYNLKVHVQSFHQNIRPFVCPKRFCNKAFHFQHLLRRHLDMHTKNSSTDNDAKPPPTKKRKKPTRTVRAPLISNISGYVPELWRKLTPYEINCYINNQPDDSSDEIKDDRFTQRTCTPLSSQDFHSDDSNDTKSDDMIDKVNLSSYGETTLTAMTSHGETTLTAMSTESDEQSDENDRLILEPLRSLEEAEAILKGQQSHHDPAIPSCSKGVVKMTDLSERLHHLATERRQEELTASSSPRSSSNTLTDSCHMQSLTESESESEVVQRHVQQCVS